MKKIVFFLLINISCKAAVPTCSNPLTVHNDTVIELTEDIVITKKGSPVLAGADFGLHKAHKVTFYATKPRNVIVTKKGIWDLTSFNSSSKIIEFAGQARLVVEAGAHLLFNNGILRMSGQSKLIFKGPESRN